MKLQDLKFDLLEKNSQAIIFNEQGVIIESDDNLIKLEGSQYNIFSDSMFCGMDQVFLEMADGEEINFDCIETDLFGKTSHYDFIIKKMGSGENALFGWMIFDFGSQYQRIFELQQERNVAEIQAKKAQQESSKLRDEKDAIEKLYGELNNEKTQQYILIKADNLLINMDLKEIDYFEAYGDYIKVHTEEKMYVTYHTMKSIMDSLPESQFFRIHRSFIVRLDKVKNIEQYSVVIKDKVLPIGKNFKSTLVEKIGQL